MKGEVEKAVGQTEQTCLLKPVHLKRMQIQRAFLIPQSLAQIAPFSPQRKGEGEKQSWRDWFRKAECCEPGPCLQ